MNETRGARELDTLLAPAELPPALPASRQSLALERLAIAHERIAAALERLAVAVEKAEAAK